LTALVGRTNAILSRYDGLLESVTNPEILLSPLITKEAELSSRIEGTVATANEVYEAEAGAEFEPEKNADIEEILNYRYTLRLATDAIKDHPISLQMIRMMHEELMRGVRGQDKNPGQFRETQNWIGPKGCSIEDATYVPPSPVRLRDHLESFEKFLEYDDPNLDPIVKTALVHAQFELMHPFDDGNGRIGRLLVPLYLAQIGSLVSPSLYVSAYFEEQRDTYTARLAEITAKGDWKAWITFFLEAVVSQAGTNLTLVREVLELYEDMKTRIAEATHSEQSIRILDALFDRPVFRSSELYEALGIQRQRATGYIRALKENKILHELRPASGSAPALLSFDALLEIVA
jgi:Fic family protein